ncbi:N-acetyl-gamma-glutamyl-phosphate reductase [Peribacillus sp. NPDC006672]|uniref:N-acetyl-gamma-glutamyl-phosphate reductase n=1 Tax=Peribacillus sp. NPDC006672 TaxID=3390606 RepID=UPI003CFDF875
MEKLKVAIIGGNGFTGMELYRILEKHPVFEVTFISSESKSGESVEKSMRSFANYKSKKLRFNSIKDLEGNYEAIFACLPTGVLPRYIENIIPKTKYLFNISGDYRLGNTELSHLFYPETHKYATDFKTHYFIPELSDIVKDAKIINLPGCMAVASIYSLYPLVKESLVESNIIIDAKTGSSGGGKNSKEHHAERAQNFRPHKLHGHRHKPEIEYAFNHYLSNEKLDLFFSVYSLSLPRGIMVSSYSKLKENVTEGDVRKAFYKSYNEHKFIQYFKTNQVGINSPMIKTVVGTNHAEIGVYIEDRNCVSVASIDNLLKGAAGQAVQAANLYFDLPEEMGLNLQAEGVWP